MPVDDLYQDLVIRCLLKAGWSLIKEQVSLYYISRRVVIDIRATKDGMSSPIYVEVKSFLSKSPLEDFANLIGKMIIYQTVLEALDYSDPLYMAVPLFAYNGIMNEPLGQLIIAQTNMKFLIFDPSTEEIVLWQH